MESRDRCVNLSYLFTMTDAQVSRDIVFLTNALTQSRSDQHIDTNARKERRPLSTFQHIATLLTTGAPPGESNGDPNAGRTVAVTGRVDLEERMMYCSILRVYKSVKRTSQTAEETSDGWTEDTREMVPTMELLFDGKSKQNVSAEDILNNWMDTK